MAVFRVKKNENYTVMANYHLRDKTLSLKAKGLLSLMLSLPDDWDYTTKGLARICKDGLDSVQATVRELEGAGYLRRERLRDDHGRLTEITYDILECPEPPENETAVTESSPKRENPVLVEPPKRDFPVLEKPVQGKPVLENPALENPVQLNTNILSTDILNNNILNTNGIKNHHDGDAHAQEKSAAAEPCPKPTALKDESEDVKRLVAETTASLMARYGNGKRTAPFDEETAYRAMVGAQGFDKARAELLEYCFAQAARNGCRGKWSYVLGVLRRLDERGIRTAQEAENYSQKPPERRAQQGYGKKPFYGSGELGQAELEAIQRVLREENEDGKASA